MLVRRVRKQALTAADQDREHHHPVLVDKVVLDQRVNQGPAAGDEDWSAVLLLELRDLAGDVAAYSRPKRAEGRSGLAS
jgi:hypothetical protein